jgi:hypothetical protein
MARKKKKDNHKKTIKKKRVDELPCGLCQSFWSSSNRRNGNIRHCNISGDERNFYDESCQEFETSGFFFCEGFNFQCSTDVCISRIKRGTVEECGKCKLGWNILLYYAPPTIKIKIREEK